MKMQFVGRLEKVVKQGLAGLKRAAQRPPPHTALGDLQARGRASMDSVASSERVE
jgi:hypothetical protein